MDAVSAIARIATPIGTVELGANDHALLSVRITADNPNECAAAGHDILDAAVKQMRDWFDGKRRDFDIPLMPLASQRGEELRHGMVAIPYGETMTYGQLAQKLHSAPRAVGQACMRNPYPIIIPCHRVISASGPEHYSGGDGPRTKAWLIAFEQGRPYPYGTEPREQFKLF
jgi:methylated-DNA-[protein]-cysteine S-methyltransferase